MCPTRAWFVWKSVALGVVLACASAGAKNWQDDCVFSPSAENAVSAECEFRSIETHIRLDKPSSIESLRITRGRNLFLDEGVLASFTSLRSIYITGIDILSIRRNSLVSVIEQRAIELAVEQVDIVALDPGALSDWRHPESTISMKSIRRLSISKQGLAPNSTFKDVTFENIPVLYMEPVAIQSRIGQLKLQNLSLSVCMKDAFSGHIGHLSLSSVSSDNVKESCISATSGWKSISVRSSRLSYIEASAFHGSVENVLIETSSLGDVQPGAFELTVARFSLASCDIDNLGELALKVKANQSISLHSLQVNKMQGNALQGLTILQDDSHRRPDDELPQVCLSALTVNDASEDALTLSEDSPVSLYGRVCPSEAVAAREHTQCIGEKSPALVSIGVFRERCCSDDLGSKSPACPSLAWVPYLAAAVVLVVLVLVAFFCYRRQLRAKRWQVARRTEHNSLSIVPSVRGLGRDKLNPGSPNRAAAAGSGPGNMSDANSPEDVFEEAEGRGERGDSGPLASWLQTLRETVPRLSEGGCPETLEMLEAGGCSEQGPSQKTALRNNKCPNVQAESSGEEAGSDTESVLHESTQHSEAGKGQNWKPTTSTDPQHSIEKDALDEAVPEVTVTDADNCHQKSDEGDGAHLSHKVTKKAPQSSNSTFGSSKASKQPSESKQEMPVYATSTKQKPSHMTGQISRQLSASLEVLSARTDSSQNFHEGDSAIPSRGACTTPSVGKPMTSGRRPTEVEYAEVFNSLPRVPNTDPEHRRRRSSVDSNLYSDVYQALGTDVRYTPDRRGPRRNSADRDEVYDDLLDTMNSNLGQRQMALARDVFQGGAPLMPYPEHVAEHVLPHLGRGDMQGGAPSHGPRLVESPLYVGADGATPISSYCTVPRSRYVYVEKSERDHPDPGRAGTTTRASYLYAEISDFAPSVRQSHGQIPTYATVSKTRRQPKHSDDHKAKGWSSWNPFAKKNRGEKVGTERHRRRAK
ncbi:uncharacterized protein LOC122373915 [Amphibalanus amphitrite]|uniref:uncharacterized protein LOC122373915 n=1 Tax=Amphibalanus amphitrite TaxID=1232801 RepID=UPI001C926B00|nr:uncharacterized protein LOC122373915 [Amphibalanus amphitrite]